METMFDEPRQPSRSTADQVLDEINKTKVMLAIDGDEWLMEQFSKSINHNACKTFAQVLAFCEEYQVRVITRKKWTP